MKLKVFHEDEWREYPAKTYAEYTHEWLGEPHASVSVRLDGDGNETARNEADNPACLNNRGWTRNTSAWDVTFVNIDDHPEGIITAVHSVHIGEGDHSSNSLSLYDVGGSMIGQSHAIGVWVKSNVPATESRSGMRLDPGVWTWTMHYRTGTVAGLQVRPDDVSTVDDMTAEAWATGAVIVAADTEAAALAQVEHYFDGDTVPDRTWVDFQPRNISGIKRIWPRSVTPPPPGVHYAWLGEPHASLSVRLDGDGNETARNWLRYPSFELGTTGVRTSQGKFDLRETQYPPRQFSGETALHVLRTEAEPGEYDFVGQRIYDPLPAGWVAFKVHDFQAITSDIGALRLRVDFRIGGRDVANLGPVTPVSITSNIPGRDQFTHVVEVPEGVEWADVYLYTFSDMDRTPPPITSQYTTDAWQVATADTEAAALAQVEHYFDGDTASDRAHDLWYNQDGVPHEWVNGTGWTPIH